MLEKGATARLTLLGCAKLLVSQKDSPVKVVTLTASRDDMPSTSTLTWLALGL